MQQVFWNGMMVDAGVIQLAIQGEAIACLGQIDVIEGTADMVTSENGAISFPSYGWRRIRLSSGLQVAPLTIVVAEQGADDFVFVSREHLTPGDSPESAKRRVLLSCARHGDWDGSVRGPKGLAGKNMILFGASTRPPSYVHSTQ